MPRAMPKKIMRKSKKQSPNMVNALSTVTLHHNKLLGSLFDTLYFEAKAMREFELSAIPTAGSTIGRVPLQYNTAAAVGNTQFPLHIYDITAIASQDGTSTTTFGNCLYMDNATSVIGFTGAPFTTYMPTLSCVGTNDGGSFNSNQNLNRTLMEYADIRLDLFQRDKYSSEYTVELMKINDETITPDNATGTSLVGQYNFQAFWKNQVRPLYTNSLMPTDARTNYDMKGKHTVLWEKTYKLRERLNDADSYIAKRVNIFKKIQKVLRYNENPQNPTAMTGDNPETNIYNTTDTGRSTTQTRPKDRIYLVIKGKQTIDYNAAGQDTAAPAVGDIHSYSIYFKSKHVTPQSGV
jgi:hypothetical protein